MLGTHCGSEVPDPIVSSGSSLFIRFNTDGSIVRYGKNETEGYGNS